MTRLRTLIGLHVLALVFCTIGPAESAWAAGPKSGESKRIRATLPIGQLDPDPAIATIRKVLGYDWAREVTSHAQMETYLRALAKSAPHRARLVQYGSSYEGRGLYYLVITSPENLKRLEQIRANNLRLSDPRKTTLAEAGALMAKMPAVVWLAASVHGNELSCTEAMLLTAYHLLADRRPETKSLLDKLVILIDPLQNPDGRERFVNVFRESRGVFIDAHPLSTEHAERWPGGRFNHYLFDMNRDWFLQSQRETVCKVRAYLRWQPQIFVDAHEMGRNSTYFFVPPTDPINPFMLSKQRDWLYTLGREQASWFDRYGFAYTTREMFDAFYPGYGSEWPTLQGGLGILWEQAGTRGLVVDRDDETKLQYRDAVLHHYVSSLATLDTAADRRSELLSDFYDSRSRGLQLGNEGQVKHFFLPRRPRPNRSARLAHLLRRNGIDVYLVEKDFRIMATDVRTGKKAERVISRGSFQVPVAQPAGRLVRALLDTQVEMDEAYVKRQLKRKKDALPDQIYDVTAWSLPLAFDVPCLATDRAPLAGRPWDGKVADTSRKLAEARVAYLVRPTDGALVALSDWLRRRVRVHVTDKAFTLGERKFPAGTLILKTHENRANLHQVVQRAIETHHIQVVPTDTGFVTEGAHLGGPYVKWVKPPRIILALNRPARSSVGHTWHLFDQVLRYPTTRVSCRNLAQLDLHEFNVLILPDGSYSDAYGFDTGFAGRLKQWVRDGGTLVLVGGAAVWASDKKVDLITLRRVARPRDDTAKSTKSGKTEDAGSKDRPERWPDGVPGAFLKANVFEPHFLSFGCPRSMSVFFRGNVFFEPLRKEEGRSVVRFAPEPEVLVSGFCWPETKKLVAESTYVACKPAGKGYVIAFSGDPNYRAMYPNLQRLFINACLFGPGH